jgi:hypothetical protein
MGLGSGITDLEKNHLESGSRGQKKHRIPYPDPQQCKLLRIIYDNSIQIQGASQGSGPTLVNSLLAVCEYLLNC